MALDNEPTTEVSDEDIVRDEEDREALLVTQKSGVRRLFNRERDPNAPRPVELSRKDLRKQRRRERRARRRRRRGEDEAALMFEMEGGEDNDDDSSSTSSNELFLEKKQPRQVGRGSNLVFELLLTGSGTEEAVPIHHYRSAPDLVAWPSDMGCVQDVIWEQALAKNKDAQVEWNARLCADHSFNID